jgi:hypothetical protein
MLYNATKHHTVQTAPLDTSPPLTVLGFSCRNSEPVPSHFHSSAAIVFRNINTTRLDNTAPPLRRDHFLRSDFLSLSFFSSSLLFTLPFPLLFLTLYLS